MPCFPGNKTISYINFSSKGWAKLGFILRGCLIFFPHITIYIESFTIISKENVHFNFKKGNFLL